MFLNNAKVDISVFSTFFHLHITSLNTIFNFYDLFKTNLILY